MTTDRPREGSPLGSPPPGRRKTYVHNIPASRRLQKEQTPSEVILWTALRDSDLDGLKFRRQHAIGRFVVDSYCDNARLAIEIDGAIHLEPEQLLKDRVRQQELESRDIEFVRVTADDVERQLPAVLQAIRTLVRRRGVFSADGTIAPPLPQRRERGLGGEG